MIAFFGGRKLGRLRSRSETEGKVAMVRSTAQNHKILATTSVELSTIGFLTLSPLA
jgi:hypothetical protein